MLQNSERAIVASRQWFLLLAEPDIHLLSPARRPSQKIEFVFSASLETIRRVPQEIALRRPVGHSRDLAACTLSHSVLFLASGGGYAGGAAVVLCDHEVSLAAIHRQQIG